MVGRVRRRHGRRAGLDEPDVLHDLMPGVEDMSEGNLGYLQLPWLGCGTPDCTDYTRCASSPFIASKSTSGPRSPSQCSRSSEHPSKKGAVRVLERLSRSVQLSEGSLAQPKDDLGKAV
jgi:hypothetical protein